MKFFIILLLISLTIGCNSYGYIYDEKNGEPLISVLVTDLNDIENKTYTDKEGKFSFRNCGSLAIEKEGFVNDTLKDYGCKPDPYCFNGKIFYMIRK